MIRYRHCLVTLILFGSMFSTANAQEVDLSDDGGFLQILGAIAGKINFGIGIPTTASKSDPTKVGDVVGRDLAVWGAGMLGHLGVYDGNSVVQAGPNGTPNTIHYESLQDFKNATSYWGKASANIPEYYFVTNCFTYTCIYTANGSENTKVQSRSAIAKRAYQIYLIGADYTVFDSYVEAEPAAYLYPASRGRYRCDSFVASVLFASIVSKAGYGVNNDSSISLWVQRAKQLINMPKTPTTVFDTVNGFQ